MNKPLIITLISACVIAFLIIFFAARSLRENNNFRGAKGSQRLENVLK